MTVLTLNRACRCIAVCVSVVDVRGRGDLKPGARETPVVWIPYDAPLEPGDLFCEPPTCQLLWIRTESGITATGWITHVGGIWSVDAFRLPKEDGYDKITHWAVIEYPEG